MQDKYSTVMVNDTPHLFEVIELPNGLKLEAWDFSQKIAGDRFRVTLVIRIEVDLDRHFTPQSDRDRDIAQELRAELGDTLSYQFRDERNFIAADRKEAVLDKLFDVFKKDSLPYFTSPRFAYQFVLSTYSKLKKDPFRFRAALKNSFFPPSNSSIN